MTASATRLAAFVLACALAGPVLAQTGAPPANRAQPPAEAPRERPTAGTEGTGRTDLGDVLKLIDRVAKEREAGGARERAREAAERAAAERDRAEQAAAEAERLKRAAQGEAAAAASAPVERSTAAPSPPPRARAVAERPARPTPGRTAARPAAPVVVAAPSPASVEPAEPAPNLALPPALEPKVVLIEPGEPAPPPAWWKTPNGIAGLGAGLIALLAIAGYALLRHQSPKPQAAGGPDCGAEVSPDAGDVSAPDFGGLEAPSLTLRVTHPPAQADTAYPAR